MTFLYILGGLLLLILLILMLRIRITVSYSKSPGADGVSAFAEVGPVRIKLYPKKSDKVKLSDFSAKKYRQLLEEDTMRSAETKPDEQKPEKKKNEFLPGGFGETAELILELVEKFTGHLRCEILKLRLNVGTKDAASTALTYSGASAGVFFLIETLNTKTDLRIRSPENVYVRPDFGGGEICGDIGVRLSIRVINILRAGSGFIKNYNPHHDPP